MINSMENKMTTGHTVYSVERKNNPGTILRYGVCLTAGFVKHGRPGTGGRLVTRGWESVHTEVVSDLTVETAEAVARELTAKVAL
jgi:hypothetical protein